MGFKNKIKSVLGAERVSNIKGHIMHYVCTTKLKVQRAQKLQYDKNYLAVKKEISSPNFHVFRGYYDLNYFSLDGEKFLCHRLPINADNNRTTRCQVGYFDLKSNEFVKIADTSAWCWQQGSRLRWHPINQNLILVNDVENFQYCTKVYDIHTKECLDIIGLPLYDLTYDFKFGISLNYSRLQRLRPGYGYNYFDDKTKDDNAPETDGIFLINLKTRKTKLIYSLKNLSDKVDKDADFVHYVNHISIAPDGKNFMFFHIYVKRGQSGWETVLYISDIEGTHLKALEKEDRVSHYCWIDNENLMVTCRKEDGSEYYCTYNIVTGAKNIISTFELNTDGHPNPVATTELFLTDTYPLQNSIQSIKIFSLGDKKAKTIASLYHDYRLRGEKRCDLHPSLSQKGDYVSVDTTYRNKQRRIVIFKRFMEEK